MHVQLFPRTWDSSRTGEERFISWFLLNSKATQWLFTGLVHLNPIQRGEKRTVSSHCEGGNLMFHQIPLKEEDEPRKSIVHNFSYSRCHTQFCVGEEKLTLGLTTHIPRTTHDSSKTPSVKLFGASW